MGAPARSRLLSIPPEVREIIYSVILHPDANRRYHEDEYTSYDYTDAFVLFRLNKQIYTEASKVFRSLNTFVRIETPWLESPQYVHSEGHVPLLAQGEKAARFEAHSLSVQIYAPAVEMTLDEGELHMFVILVDDLEAFTRSWFYSSLSLPTMNPQLRLVLRLRDPFTPEHEEKIIPKALQEKLILPFGIVKKLHSVDVGGDPKPYPSLIAQVRERQRKPNNTPEHCLRETTRLKLEGNAELNAGRYREALALYNAAWRAMHIEIKGHKRHIHGDTFFDRELREEPFIGKNGPSERLILRVQLVANTLLALLKAQDYAECKFWGMRSITTLREAMVADGQHEIMPQDEAVLGFPAASEMGKIYFRTALAVKALDETDEARKLLKVAAVYLPRDESVKREVEASTLRLG